VSGVGGRIPSYELPLVRFELMGLELEQFLVLSQDILPEDLDVDGLIGMDLLRGRVLTLDALAGSIRLAP
jgi:hypothetical protein